MHLEISVADGSQHLKKENRKYRIYIEYRKSFACNKDRYFFAEHLLVLYILLAIHYRQSKKFQN